MPDAMGIRALSWFDCTAVARSCTEGTVPLDKLLLPGVTKVAD